MRASVLCRATPAENLRALGIGLRIWLGLRDGLILVFIQGGLGLFNVGGFGWV
jgi:hypothetical protein